MGEKPEIKWVYNHNPKESGFYLVTITNKNLIRVEIRFYDSYWKHWNVESTFSLRAWAELPPPAPKGD